MAAISTNIQGFNVGTDASFVISDQYGDVFSNDMLGHLTMFSSRAEDNMVKMTPISRGGRPVYQVLWNGHRGSMRFTRMNGAFQKIMITMQNAYHNAGLISQMSILMKVRNRDLSYDTYQFTGVQLASPDYGSYNATREVTMSVDFHASTLDAQGGLDALMSGLNSAIS